MNLEQIKSAVKAGKTVHWSNTGYRIIGTDPDNLLVCCDSNQSCVGLTWADGVTLSDKPEKFFLAKKD